MWSPGAPLEVGAGHVKSGIGSTSSFSHAEPSPGSSGSWGRLWCVLGVLISPRKNHQSATGRGFLPSPLHTWVPGGWGELVQAPGMAEAREAEARSDGGGGAGEGERRRNRPRRRELGKQPPGPCTKLQPCRHPGTGVSTPTWVLQVDRNHFLSSRLPF